MGTARPLVDFVASGVVVAVRLRLVMPLRPVPTPQQAQPRPVVTRRAADAVVVSAVAAAQPLAVTELWPVRTRRRVLEVLT